MSRKIKFKGGALSTLAAKYGLRAWDGHMAIACAIAKAKNLPMPARKLEARKLIAQELNGVGVVVKKNKKRGLPRQKFASYSDAFLASYEWRKTRMVVLKRDGARCACCGATPADGLRMHVDHIKPRKFYPELALDLSNLQVLCEICNHGKGNWDNTDWRSPHLENLPESAADHMLSISRH